MSGWLYLSGMPPLPQQGREATPSVSRSRAGHPCVEVSPREADYLLALLDLGRDKVVPTQAALARAAGVSPPTALQMVRRLRELGLVAQSALGLTVEGTSAALVLASRRLAAEHLTRDVLGLAEGVQQEAAKLAPSMSRELARRLIRRAANSTITDEQR